MALTIMYKDGFVCSYSHSLKERDLFLYEKFVKELRHKNKKKKGCGKVKPVLLTTFSVCNRYRNQLGSTWRWQTKTKNINSSSEKHKKPSVILFLFCHLIGFHYIFSVCANVLILGKLHSNFYKLWCSSEKWPSQNCF